MRVARGQHTVRVCDVRHRVGGSDNDAQRAGLGQPREFETGGGAYLGSGIGSGGTTDGLESELEASFRRREGDDPRSIGTSTMDKTSDPPGAVATTARVVAASLITMNSRLMRRG